MEFNEIREEIGKEDDVARKRYLMFQLFEKLLNTRFSIEDKSKVKDRISKLKDLDGYMYKLSQDFLTSSSTMQKEKSLEKIIEHVERKQN